MNTVAASTATAATFALGLASSGVFWAYTLSILSALLCLVYGIMNWNKPAKDQTKEAEEEVKWEKKDTEVMK